jgi:hypothetical protein
MASEAIFEAIKKKASKLAPARTEQQVLAEFIKAWRAKWRAKTSCQPGYVVEKCRQYKVTSSTPAPAENPLTLN